MTGRTSRNKGAVAEREAAELLRRHGFKGERTGRNGRTSEDITHDIPGVHMEVKRRETLAIPQWVRQAEEDCGELEPVVMFRQSRQPWRVVVLAEEWLRLKRMESLSLHNVDKVGVRNNSS